MENGSLETQLHGVSRASALGWHVRMKIPLGVARKKHLPSKLSFKEASMSKQYLPLLGKPIALYKCIDDLYYIILMESPRSCVCKEWRKKQIMKITDKVYNRIKTQTGRSTLSFEELYIAALLVYNDINKYLPGPDFDPPSKDEIQAFMHECDMNMDGAIDHEEFVKFVQKLTANTFSTVSQGLIIALVLAPTVALATKRATEGVAGVGLAV